MRKSSRSSRKPDFFAPTIAGDSKEAETDTVGKTKAAIVSEDEVDEAFEEVKPKKRVGFKDLKPKASKGSVLGNFLNYTKIWTHCPLSRFSVGRKVDQTGDNKIG